MNDYQIPNWLKLLYAMALLGILIAAVARGSI